MKSPFPFILSPLSFILLLLSFSVSAQKFNISLFNEQNLQTILITPVSGSYSLFYGNSEYILFPNQIIYISRSGDSVKVRDMSTNLGTWKRVSLVGKGENDAIRINPIVPSIPARIYDDNLGFYVDFNRMMVVNIVDQEKYIAGVVEAEAGPAAHIEFYKAQALIARTYALRHTEKHAGEGFNLCDDVHCQVYKGKSAKNPDILKAAQETKGLVVVDTSNQPIVGAFHANCGGQTANSGDVWVTQQSYLVSVTDTYCRSLPSAHWEIKIPLQEWKDFIASKGVDVANIQDSKYNFNPKTREYVYPIGGKEIPFKDIRNHFKLRSAYFSIEVSSSNVRMKGKGYGHGVGLCQDGANQMARRGKSYEEILQHYFTGIKIVNFSEVAPQEHHEEEVGEIVSE